MIKRVLQQGARGDERGEQERIKTERNVERGAVGDRMEAAHHGFDR